MAEYVRPEKRRDIAFDDRDGSAEECGGGDVGERVPAGVGVAVWGDADVPAVAVVAGAHGEDGAVGVDFDDGVQLSPQVAGETPVA